METIYRQIAFHRLNDTQKKDKLQKDSEYEIAVQNLTVSWKRGEITLEVYRQKKSELWHTYKGWAISQGLYEKVTPIQRLAEVERGLSGRVKEINLIRQELGHKPLVIREEIVEVR